MKYRILHLVLCWSFIITWKDFSVCRILVPFCILQCLNMIMGFREIVVPTHSTDFFFCSFKCFSAWQCCFSGLRCVVDVQLDANVSDILSSTSELKMQTVCFLKILVSAVASQPRTLTSSRLWEDQIPRLFSLVYFMSAAVLSDWWFVQLIVCLPRVLLVATASDTSTLWDCRALNHQIAARQTGRLVMLYVSIFIVLNRL